MKNLVCSICKKEIESNDTISVFYDGNEKIITHTMQSINNYDCDYVYMLETLSPEVYNSVEEYEENREDE